MKPHKQHLLAVIFGVAVVFVIYSVYRAVKAGLTSVTDLVTAPVKALQDLYGVTSTAISSAASTAASTVGAAASAATQDAAAAATIPAEISASQALDQQLSSTVESDYAPGGRLYNQKLASQGQAAADAQWAQVQQDYANQASQSSWLSVVGL